MYMLIFDGGAECFVSLHCNISQVYRVKRYEKNDPNKQNMYAGTYMYEKDTCIMLQVFSKFN